jgi:hypothetical protein
LCEFMVKRHPLLYFKEISNTHDALRKCKKWTRIVWASNIEKTKYKRPALTFPILYK